MAKSSHRRSFGCDLVLVQLGVDSHVFDILGGLQTSTELGERDRIVFERLGHLPLAWCLSGGYQFVKGAKTISDKIAPVLELHRQTAQIATQVLSGSTKSFSTNKDFFR